MQVQSLNVRAQLPQELRLCTKVPVRVLPADLARIERLARDAGVNRSVIVRRLLAAGLHEVR